MMANIWRRQTYDRLINSLSEAQDEAAAENTQVQRGEGGIGHWKEERRAADKRWQGEREKEIKVMKINPLTRQIIRYTEIKLM